MIRLLICLTLILGFPMTALSAEGAEQERPVRRTYCEVQEVNFEEMDLQGTIRSPDGAYLVQKRGIQFLPLYDVQRDFDQRIRDSLYSVR